MDVITDHMEHLEYISDYQLMEKWPWKKDTIGRDMHHSVLRAAAASTSTVYFVMSIYVMYYIT